MDSNSAIQEMQFIEQGLNTILLQKQAFQLELSETQTAIKEIHESGDDVFKIVGNLMIKSNKEKIKVELGSKEKFLDVRIKTLEKQEISLTEKLQKLRDDLLTSSRK